jgi:hypothetical protein
MDDLGTIDSRSERHKLIPIDCEEIPAQIIFSSGGSLDETADDISGLFSGSMSISVSKDLL